MYVAGKLCFDQITICVTPAPTKKRKDLVTNLPESINEEYRDESAINSVVRAAATDNILTDFGVYLISQLGFNQMLAIQGLMSKLTDPNTLEYSFVCPSTPEKKLEYEKQGFLMQLKRTKGVDKYGTLYT